MKWIERKRVYLSPYIDLAIEDYRKLGICDTVAKVLVNRGVPYEDMRKLLTEPDTLLESPLKMYGCKEAGDAIIAMVEDHKEIQVFADYDCDGLMSGHIMYHFLKTYLNATVKAYYPERNEGYGLSVNFVRQLPDNAGVITVDNGISAYEARELCKKRNIPVVVTDHHTPTGPIEGIVCDPHVSKNGYGHHLCGAGVAWKVCQYIADKLNLGSVDQYLPYVAVGTVADVMPMTLENQALVKMGLGMLNEKGNTAGHNISHYARFLKCMPITVEDIAWKIAPALNACGRMGNTKIAARYIDSSSNNLKPFAEEVTRLNEERKSITQAAFQSIDPEILQGNNVCFFNVAGYPPGISGLIANKIAENSGKPAIVYIKQEDGTYIGSVRTAGINLLPFLEEEKAAGHIINCGGHKFACAVIMKEDIETFKKSLNDALQGVVAPVQEKTVVIDGDIHVDHIHKWVYVDVNKIPTDQKLFPAPVFIVRNLKIESIHTSSRNSNNICFHYYSTGKIEREIWAWGMGNKYRDEMGSPPVIDLVGTLSRQTWGTHKDETVLNVIDIRTSEIVE